MSAGLEQLRDELATAHQVLVREDVIDAFGHVSVRHPDDSGLFLLPYSSAPNCVTPEDVALFDLTSEPAEATDRRLFQERFIHGCIYSARPDVQAICHHHPKSLMPYCATGEAPVAISQAGAAMGESVAFWDSRDAFGATNLLVSNAEQGASLAQALGAHWLVLMRRHGATVVGRSLHEAVYRAISACQNADILTQAGQLGEVVPLSQAEIERVETLVPGQAERSWQYWVERLDSGRPGAGT